MASEKLTDKTVGTVLDLTDVFHAVDKSDVTSDPQGTSKQYTIQKIVDLGGGGHVIEDEGTPLTQRADLNFTGDGVSVADAGAKTVVTIGSGAFETLVDATTVNWDLDDGKTAVVTLGGNRTLAITNQANGMFGLLKVIQSGGSNTLLLPANSKVVDGGGGVIALSSGAGDIDILTFVYDGTDFLWNIGRDYS